MDLLKQSYDLISRLSEDATRSSDGPPDLAALDRRRQIIEHLGALNTAARALGALIEEKIAAATALQERDLAAVDAIIGRAAASIRPAASSIDTVKPNGAVTRTWSGVLAAPPREVAPPQQPSTALLRTKSSAAQRVKITEALALMAVTVSSFDEVAADGRLYYNQHADHFAFRLAGKLFHGNIGTIFIDEENPTRVKTCRFPAGKCHRAQCGFYHPPALTPTVARPPREYRNYVAGSWIYSPGRARCRKFGSRPNLDVDIAEMGEEDIDRFHDQAMHDLLCSMLLRLYTAPM